MMRANVKITYQKPEPVKRKKVQVYVFEETAEALRYVSQIEGVAQSDVVHVALLQWLALRTGYRTELSPEDEALFRRLGSSLEEP